MKSEFMLLSVGGAILVAALVGCSPPFPREQLEKVEQNIPFTVLQKDSNPYVGKLLLLGGTIVETKNLKEGTCIEVLQRPLDGDARPELSDRTDGRFLIVTRQFLDSAVYHQGRMITVIGEASLPQVFPLNDIEYNRI